MASLEDRLKLEAGSTFSSPALLLAVGFATATEFNGNAGGKRRCFQLSVGSECDLAR